MFVEIFSLVLYLILLIWIGVGIWMFIPFDKIRKRIRCKLHGHDWALGMNGGFMGFLGRTSIHTGESETAYTCKICNEFKFIKGELPKNYKKQLKKAGWNRLDSKKL